MSALPLKTDIDRACRDVRFVPKADILLLQQTPGAADLGGVNCARVVRKKRPR